jgi:hypothetical protein
MTVIYGEETQARNIVLSPGGVLEVAYAIGHEFVDPSSWNAHAARDCTLATVIAAQTRSARPVDCGALDPSKGASDRTRARQCMEDALAKPRSFVFREQHVGLDSQVASGYFGLIDHGRLVTFEASYDSDPCGGGCPWRGGSTIRRCTQLIKASRSGHACQRDVSSCFECERAVEVSRCLRTMP